MSGTIVASVWHHIRLERARGWKAEAKARTCLVVGRRSTVPTNSPASSPWRRVSPLGGIVLASLSSPSPSRRPRSLPGARAA
jgi:hypothetical protein